MTLVVAKQKGEIVALVSDTGITKQNARLPAAEHIPKIAILNSEIAVGFSGEPDLAVRILNDASELTGKSYRTVTEYFLRRHIEFDGAVDFLIGFNRPLSKLAAISEKKIRQHQKVDWIGDHSAFEAYQRHRSLKGESGVTSRYEVPLLFTSQESEAKLKNPTFDMIGSMRYVIYDPHVGSVFGQIVAVSNSDGPFSFRPYTLSLDQQPSALVLPPSYRAAINAEMNELKQYAGSCFVTLPTSRITGIAYHFARPKLTYMYWNECGRPLSIGRVFERMNIVEFQEATRLEMQAEWTGSLALQGAPPQDYGVSANLWQPFRR